MAEEATQSAAIMVRLMNNIDLVMIGAAAGYLVNKMTGRRQQQMMG